MAITATKPNAYPKQFNTKTKRTPCTHALTLDVHIK